MKTFHSSKFDYMGTVHGRYCFRSKHSDPSKVEVILVSKARYVHDSGLSTYFVPLRDSHHKEETVEEFLKSLDLQQA